MTKTGRNTLKIFKLTSNHGNMLFNFLSTNLQIFLSDDI